MPDNMIKIGTTAHPYGAVWDHKGKTDLVHIFIFYDGNRKKGINLLQFQYMENGNLVLSGRPADITLGRNFKTVKLNYPDEYLTSLSGTVFRTDDTVSSITFGTNKGSHGPIGSPRSSDDFQFKFELGEDRQFGGFHGSYLNGELESIGVYLKPISTLSSLRRDEALV